MPDSDNTTPAVQWTPAPDDSAVRFGPTVGNGIQATLGLTADASAHEALVSPVRQRLVDAVLQRLDGEAVFRSYKGLAAKVDAAAKTAAALGRKVTRLALDEQEILAGDTTPEGTAEALCRIAGERADLERKAADATAVLQQLDTRLTTERQAAERIVAALADEVRGELLLATRQQAEQAMQELIASAPLHDLLAAQHALRMLASPAPFKAGVASLLPATGGTAAKAKGQE